MTNEESLDKEIKQAVLANLQQKYYATQLDFKITIEAIELTIKKCREEFEKEIKSLKAHYVFGDPCREEKTLSAGSTEVESTKKDLMKEKDAKVICLNCKKKVPFLLDGLCWFCNNDYHAKEGMEIGHQKIIGIINQELIDLPKHKIKNVIALGYTDDKIFNAKLFNALNSTRIEVLQQLLEEIGDKE